MPDIDCGGGGIGTSLEQFETTSYDNEAYDNWHVKYGYYRLSKVKMWKDAQVTSGFEVYYDPIYPIDDFSGWP